MMLLADLQQDFVDLPLTMPFARLRRNVAALMELAAIFDIPRVVTAVPMAEGEVLMLMRELGDARGGAR